MTRLCLICRAQEATGEGNLGPVLTPRLGNRPIPLCANCQQEAVYVVDGLRAWEERMLSVLPKRSN